MATYTGVTGSGGTNGSGTVSSTSMSVTSGNVLVAVVRGETNVAPTAAMFSNDGTAFTWAVHYTIANANVSIGLAIASVTATQSTVVTFDPAGTGRVGIVCYEFSGLGTTDSNVAATGSGSSASAETGSFTPTAAAGVVLMGLVANADHTWEADYATNATAKNATSRMGAAYDLAPAASAQTASCGLSASLGWDMAGAWWDDAAAGGVVGLLMGGHLLGGGILAGRLVN
jgi:hypothetical protein